MKHNWFLDRKIDKDKFDIQRQNRQRQIFREPGKLYDPFYNHGQKSWDREFALVTVARECNFTCPASSHSQNVERVCWRQFLLRFNIVLDREGGNTHNCILFKISAGLGLILKIFLKFRKLQPRYSFKKIKRVWKIAVSCPKEKFISSSFDIYVFQNLNAWRSTAIYCWRKTLKTFYSRRKTKRTYKYKTTLKIKSTNCKYLEL